MLSITEADAWPLQSIFHVTFLRGLFPDSYFKSTRMDNLEGSNQSISATHNCMMEAHICKARNPMHMKPCKVYNMYKACYSKTQPSNSNYLAHENIMRLPETWWKKLTLKVQLRRTEIPHEGHAAGMEIQMLRPECKDSQRLVDWVERGIAKTEAFSHLSLFHALQNLDLPIGVILIQQFSWMCLRAKGAIMWNEFHAVVSCTNEGGLLKGHVEFLNNVGVQDAIKQMYLQRLYFGISKNAEGTDLLEASSYSGLQKTIFTICCRRPPWGCCQRLLCTRTWKASGRCSSTKSTHHDLGMYLVLLMD